MEACWVTEEKEEWEKDWVEIVQEDPCTGEWTEFKVPREYAEKEWKSKVYGKSLHWGETEKREQQKKFREGQKRGAQRYENKACSENPGRPYGASRVPSGPD